MYILTDFGVSFLYLQSESEFMVIEVRAKSGQQSSGHVESSTARMDEKKYVVVVIILISTE